MTKQQRMGLGCLLAVLFIGLAAVFGVFDLQISNAVYHAENGFGIFMEKYAILLEPALISFSGVILCTYFARNAGAPHRSLKITFGAVLILGSFGYLFYEYGHDGPPTLTAVLAVLAVTDGILLVLATRLKQEKLCTLMQIAAITAIFIIVALGAVTCLKTLWGRVRFREMTDPAEFSRWFVPQGNNGHHSFPSGHTSNAATLWVLTLFAPLLRRRWQKLLCYLIPAAWIVTMAVTRVIVGAHYASDTLFAAGITLGLFYLVCWIVRRQIGTTPCIHQE